MKRGVAILALLLCRSLPAQSNPDHPATLLLDLTGLDGRALGFSDFQQITDFTPTPRWRIGQNYGVYLMGQVPGSQQIGTLPEVTSQAGKEVVGFRIPSNKAVYFTCVWKADGIGTVFMRADNEGIGYTLAEGAVRVLQLPYEFALSEYALTARIATAAISAASAANLQRAATLIETAKSAQSNSVRAAASYAALAIVMPLKEQITIELNNAAIARAGARKDFVLNYEGFGDWTDTRYKPMWAQAKAAGFKAVLTACNWNAISPSRGVYNFASIDNEVNQALAQSLEVSFSINQAVGSMPAWVAQLPFEDRKKVYYDNAFAIAQRYKDKATVLYAQAEPGLVAQGNTLEQLAELTRQSLAGARAAAPNMQFGIYLSAGAYVGYNMNHVPLGDYQSDWDILNYMVQNRIQFDFIGLEMQYATVFAPVDLQRQSELLDAYYDLTHVPIHIGETGYSSRAESYGIASPFYWRDGLTEQAQAQWADGMLRISYGHSFVKGFNWVHLTPDDTDYNQDFLTSLVGTAIFRVDGTTKKSYAVFQKFSNWMANAKPGAPGPPALIEATSGMSQSAAINTLFTAPMQATVRDFFGNPVPNAIVTFTAPGTGPSGTFPGFGLAATATTNSAGIATAPAFAAANGASFFHVVANVSGAATGAFFTLTNTAATKTAAIASVAVANGGPDIAQNTWIVIKGTNLVPDYTPAAGVIWSTAPEFAAGNMPTQIGGYPVAVTVNNKPAFIYFICRAGAGSPCATDQINALTPLDTATGPVQIIVRVGGVASAPFTANMRPSSPAFPLVGASQYLVATHADYSLVGPASLSAPGYTFTPARPGETLLLYAFGFGLPTTSLVNGLSLQSGRLPVLPVVQIGGLPATVSFAGVIGPGLYQLNVIVPSSAPNGDLPVTASYNGSNAPSGGLLTVKQ
jgi:uncharacterized protein (TIGR03437 family)